MESLTEIVFIGLYSRIIVRFSNVDNFSHMEAFKTLNINDINPINHTCASVI